MSERLELLNAFLKQNRWDDADRKLLAADASFRHYDRLTRGNETMVLMDAPPPMEDVRPFLTIAKKLEELGYSAPHVYAQDEENGFVLLEDLGDSTYTRLLKKGEDERKLYELATDLLIDLHRHDEADVVPEGLPLYDDEALKKEVMLFPDWLLAIAGFSRRQCWLRRLILFRFRFFRIGIRYFGHDTVGNVLDDVGARNKEE